MPPNQSGNYGSGFLPMPDAAPSSQADGGLVDPYGLDELLETTTYAPDVIDQSGRTFVDNTPDAAQWSGFRGRPGTEDGGYPGNQADYQDVTYGSFGNTDGRDANRVQTDRIDGDYDSD